MIGPLYNRKGYPQPSMSFDTRLTPWEHLNHPINHTRLTPWEKSRATLSALSVPRVFPLSLLGVHPSRLKVISENPPSCHSVSPKGPTFPFSEASLRVNHQATLQPEGPTFPLSEECLHEAATINTIYNGHLSNPNGTRKL